MSYLPPVWQRDDGLVRQLYQWLVMSDGGKGIPAAIRELEALLKMRDVRCTVDGVRDVVHLARNVYAALPREIVAADAKEKIKTILKSWAQLSSTDDLDTELSNARAGTSREDCALKKVIFFGLFV